MKLTRGEYIFNIIGHNEKWFYFIQDDECDYMRDAADEYLITFQRR